MVAFGEFGLDQLFWGPLAATSTVKHMGVSLQQVRSYRSFQNDEGKVVAYNLLSTPQAYVSHLDDMPQVLYLSSVLEDAL